MIKSIQTIVYSLRARQDELNFKSKNIMLHHFGGISEQESNMFPRHTAQIFYPFQGGGDSL